MKIDEAPNVPESGDFGHLERPLEKLDRSRHTGNTKANPEQLAGDVGNDRGLARKARTTKALTLLARDLHIRPRILKGNFIELGATAQREFQVFDLPESNDALARDLAHLLQS